jgi:hypothetical protein
MIDWTTGQPTARYAVLALLREQLPPGATLVDTTSPLRTVHAQGYVMPDGARRVLLVNACDAPAAVDVPGAAGGTVTALADDDAGATTTTRPLPGDTLSLGGFTVAIVTLPPPAARGAQDDDGGGATRNAISR